MPLAFASLAPLAYPGRLLLIGRSPGGTAVAGYAITGRSPSSQARRLVARDAGIWVEPTDEAVLRTGNPELLVYPAFLFGRAGVAASNGRQTSDIRAALVPGADPVAALAGALRRWDFEPDEPNYTPRISGCVTAGGAALCVVRRGPGGARSPAPSCRGRDLMNRTSLRAVAGATVLLLASGCETLGKNTAIGAGVGGLVGAGVGALAGGKKGAAIGAGVGVLAGGSVGLYLDKQARELAKVAETKRTENGVLVNMKNDILFDTGSAQLKPAAIEQLGKVGDIVAKYSDDRVRIEGYTDSVGGAELNLQLSVRRGDAVKAVLVERGVKAEQIEVHGYGETKPVADNGTADGRSKNRRVELHIDVPNPTT